MTAGLTSRAWRVPVWGGTHLPGQVCAAVDFGDRHHRVLWLLPNFCRALRQRSLRKALLYLLGHPWPHQGLRDGEQPLGMLECGSAFPPQVPQDGGSWFQASKALLCDLSVRTGIILLISSGLLIHLRTGGFVKSAQHEAGASLP